MKGFWSLWECANYCLGVAEGVAEDATTVQHTPRALKLVNAPPKLLNP